MKKELQTSEKETGTGKIEIEPEKEKYLKQEGEPEKKSQEPEPQPEIDYKRKFAESTREVQILQAKLKQLEEKLDKVGRDEIPAEEELKKIYPDWDLLDDFSKQLAEKNLILEKRLGKIEAEEIQRKEEMKWEKELEEFLEKNKILENYPKLAGKEKEFRQFAKKPTHRGVSLDVLAKAFLFEIPEEMPLLKKEPVLEPGSGGTKEVPSAKKKIDFEELRILRKENPKKWREIITKHPDWIPEEIE